MNEFRAFSIVDRDGSLHPRPARKDDTPAVGPLHPIPRSPRAAWAVVAGLLAFWGGIAALLIYATWGAP